jgi:hypothetical protein
VPPGPTPARGCRRKIQPAAIVGGGMLHARSKDSLMQKLGIEVQYIRLFPSYKIIYQSPIRLFPTMEWPHMQKLGIEVQYILIFSLWVDSKKIWSHVDPYVNRWMAHSPFMLSVLLQLSFF